MKRQIMLQRMFPLDINRSSSKTNSLAPQVDSDLCTCRPRALHNGRLELGTGRRVKLWTAALHNKKECGLLLKMRGEETPGQNHPLIVFKASCQLWRKRQYTVCHELRTHKRV